MQRGAQGVAQGQQTLSQVGNVYRPLMTGDRSAMNAALAPEMASITDIYRGAGKGLDRMQGPARDTAMAELARQKAGQLSLLRPQARMGATGAMANLGQFQVGAGQADTAGGVGAHSASGNLLAGLYGGERGSMDRHADRQSAESQAMGQGLSSLLFSILDSTANRGRGPTLSYNGFAGYPAAITPSGPR